MPFELITIDESHLISIRTIFLTGFAQKREKGEINYNFIYKGTLETEPPSTAINSCDGVSNLNQHGNCS